VPRFWFGHNSPVPAVSMQCNLASLPIAPAAALPAPLRLTRVAI